MLKMHLLLFAFFYQFTPTKNFQNSVFSLLPKSKFGSVKSFDLSLQHYYRTRFEDSFNLCKIEFHKFSFVIKCIFEISKAIALGWEKCT